MDEDDRRDWSFIVHNFTKVSLSPPSAEDLIDAGYREIQDLQKSDGWNTVGWDFDRSTFQHHGKLLQLSTNPPAIWEPRSTMGYLLKEWGAIDEREDDFVSLDDLQEFENTDLQFLSPHMHSPTCDVENVSSTRNTRAIPSTDGSGQPPAKRRRLDTNFLHNVILQPHYRPFPYEDYLPIDTTLLTAYKKRRPTFISPCDDRNMRDYLDTPGARSAWVIPVRGSLSRKGSTSALILDASEGVLPSGPVKVQDHREITWTHAALVKFWNFLFAIQQSKNLGPISLSFYAKPVPPIVVSNGADTFSVGINRHPIFDGDMPMPQTVDVPLQEPLSDVDHIKVYHDTANTMYVRNILDAWSYEENINIMSSSVDILRGKKIRMLKGAVLVLLNEKSEAILML